VPGACHPDNVGELSRIWHKPLVRRRCFGFTVWYGQTTRRLQLRSFRPVGKETAMAWTTPTLVEICIGLEINGYLPAEF
jgi:coenzyme PQQ precursor peptide PqqA